jgi:RND family efflux transporter MFP subunit
MLRPQSRWAIIVTVLALLAIPGAWLLARDRGTRDSSIATRVKKGQFRVLVTTAGELRAKKFVQIQGPANAQQADAYQMKISSIVPEGTVVKEGDVVAELDRSSIAAKLAEVQLALTKAAAQEEQAMLDSTLNLSKAREEMKTMDLSLEEKRIAKEQAIYEAPSVRRQAEIDFEKAQRALVQARVDYKTKTEQAQAKMREVGADVSRSRNKLTIVQAVMEGFTIHAPAGGMVIYIKEWNGKKKTAGSQVSPWDPSVATLPDLTQMESITYVNEIDVRKLAVGNPVSITLDADPSKRLSGKVASVANVGEQRPNADAKVFEVKVLVEQADTTLRPGMTTATAIETYSIPEALSIPLEAVMSEGDTPFVYKRNGSRVTRQQVETGAMNDDEVVIRRGLEEKDEVLLAPPPNKADVETVRLPGSGDKAKVETGDTTQSKAVPVKPSDGKGTTPPPSGRPAPALSRPAPAPRRR